MLQITVSIRNSLLVAATPRLVAFPISTTYHLQLEYTVLSVLDIMTTKWDVAGLPRLVYSVA